jgi:hypothetical protein
MNFSSLWWAIQLGLILSGPFCFLVGTGFAASTLTSPFHRPVAKAIGSIAALTVALAMGDLIRQLLVPHFWPTFGATWCAGYGWLACWVLISIFGESRDDGVPVKAERQSPFAHPLPATKKDRPESPLKLISGDTRKGRK